MDSHPPRLPSGSQTTSARDRTIISMRGRGHTLQEIADRVDLTRERVRQIIEASGEAPSASEVRTARTQRDREQVAEARAVLLEVYRAGGDVGLAAAELGIAPGVAEPVVRDEVAPADRALRSVNSARSTHVRYTDEKLLDGIRWVAGRLGRTPSTDEYTRLARSEALASTPTITNRFETWGAAVTAAGLEPNRARRSYSRKWTEDACWAVLERLVKELGDAPTVQQYELIAAGRDDLPSSATIRNRLGRWSEVRATLVAGPRHDPILARLGLSSDAPPEARDERLWLAHLEGAVSDEELVHLLERDLFTWDSSYGPDPRGDRPPSTLGESEGPAGHLRARE